jgi:hypothetical protein
VKRDARGRAPVFEMTLKNLVWPFFEREGHCASCGEEIGEEPDVVLCVACVSEVRDAREFRGTEGTGRAMARYVEIIDLN